MEKHFSIRESLAFGVSTFRKRPLFFISLTGVSVLVSIGFSFITSLFTSVFLSNANDSVISIIEGVSNLMSFFVTMFIQLGITRVYLESAEGNLPKIGDILHAKGLYPQFLFLSIISGAITVIGYILLIIPGIIFSLVLQFAPMSLIENNNGFAQAMRMSKKITKGIRLKLLVFNLVSGGVAILGFLFFGIGIFIAIPVVTLAHMYVYRTLRSQTTT